MEHSKWFERLTGNDSALNASKTARPRLNNATLSRQLNKDQLSSEVVIALARGYGQPPVEALAQTGYLSPAEASGLPRDALAKLLTDQDLIHELAVRVDDNEDAWTGTFSSVVEDAQEDEVAARRAALRDGTVREWDDTMPHAADSSIDEQEAWEKEGSDPID